MDPKIISESDDFIVLEKSAGWITNEADTTTGQPVIQTWLKKNLNYPISGSRDFRSGIVHRLDKETSGILLVAKNEETFKNLQFQFKNRKVKKTYSALVHGKVDPGEGEVKTTVGRLPWRRDRFGVVPGGREADTKYKAVSFYALPSAANQNLKYYTLLELKPKTGRTHQIRIHMKYIGHPVVADEFYAGRKTAREDRKWCSRLFLHASGISLFGPGSKTKLDFQCDLPKDLKTSLEKLEKIEG